jgi:hypothetical protein
MTLIYEPPHSYPQRVRLLKDIFEREGGLIGFCGAGGTGKTTTAELLGKCTDLPVIPSTTRAVFKQLGLETEASQEALDGPGRMHLQMAIQENFFSMTKQYRIGISDRTPIDHWCYMLYYCGNTMTHADVEAARRRIKDCLRIFRYIFYFPLMTYPGQDDGMRKTGEGYRLSYDMLVRQALDDFQVKYYTLRKGPSAWERAESIASHLYTESGGPSNSKE